jgi:hypothetical protein
MAQQAGQQQPPVKQQDLMAMAPTQAPNMGAGVPLQGAGSPQQMAQNQLPEEQGIGALPAQNMQNLAGGGITGENHFAEGIPREKMLEIVRDTNAQLPKPIEEMSDAELNAFIGNNNPMAPTPRVRHKASDYDTDFSPAVNLGANLLLGAGKGIVGAGNLAQQMVVDKTKELGGVGAGQSRIGNYFTMPQSQYNQKYVAPEVANSPGITTLLGQNQPTNAQATANNSINTGSTDTGATDTGTNNNKTPWSPGIVAPQVSAAGVALGPKPTAPGSMRDASTFYNPADIQNLLQENVTERGVLNAQNAVALENMIKARPNLGGDYEKRLKAQEAKEPEEKENLKGMSLLEAGLAIMGGNSPYAMQNIARGVEGVKSYREGLKDLQKAHDLRDQAFAHIDDMRKAQTIGDQNLAYTSKVQANDAFMNAQEQAVRGYTNALGVSAGIASNLFTSATNNYENTKRTNAEIGARTNEANARLKMEAQIADRPPEAIRTAQYLGSGNPQIQTGYNMGIAKQHATELYIKWGQLAYPNGNMGQSNEAFIKKYPSPLAYVQEGMESTGFGKTGSGGFTSDLPKNATILQAPTK